jgi:tetratricopeptide (TPR) repeat protein
VDYSAVFELTHEPSDSAVVLAGLRLLLDDAEGYRRLCRELEPAAEQTKAPSTAYTVSRISALGGKSPIDPAKAVRWAERAAADCKNAWRLSILGRAHYRAGQYDKAVLHCKASLEKDAAWPGRMLNWLVLAMACHRLGQPAEARQWLDKADQWRGQLPRGKDGGAVSPPGLYPADWVEFHVLYREAEALLKASAEKK